MKTRPNLRPLGHSGIKVPAICLGTMTWGSQNTQEQAFEQMNYALEQGIFFWDTAEVYAVPPAAETYGATETMIGNWLAKHGGRDRIILASKIVGRTPHPKPQGAPSHHHDRGLFWIREGKARHDRGNIMAAVEDSLKRLQTDYLDLYQLHWPDRPAQRFGIRDYFVLEDDFAPDGNYEALMLDVLHAMDELIKIGKIRAWGLSNETSWGVMKYIALADKHGLHRPVSVQNPYNLLNRIDEAGMMEVCHRENIAHLPYSPLAAGVLTGKYLNDQWPVGARATNAGKKGRYIKPRCEEATKFYVDLARKYNLDPAQMALAFLIQQPFITSTIIGATTMDQLKTDIGSLHTPLPEEVIAAINIIHDNNPNPGP
ncbi:MAG: tas [Alphaproteobacteria bacterium]|nr:tas [Alphaproteobacteria bacterium]